MEYLMYVPAQISLLKILELQHQPVSEEQAWALCYQLCTLYVDQHLGRGEPHIASNLLQLPQGPNNILLMNDGNVCLRMDGCSTDYFAFETEDKTVDYLGRLIYFCLDWSLDSGVERQLNETLELLVCQMTKVNLGQSMEESFQPVCTLSEVIQICKNRLYDPAQAAGHYRAVCSTLLTEMVELCRYFHNVQRNKDALQKLPIEPETRFFSQHATHGVFAWKHLAEEFSRGVALRPQRERLNVSAPLPVEYSPFEELLDDIKLRRYKLRKVQTVGKRYRWSDHHTALLEYICSRPKLKPASERKLKTWPKEEASLHELLMEEIRTADQTKLLSSMRFASKVSADDGSSSLNTVTPISEDPSPEDPILLLNSISAPDLQEAEPEVESDEKPCEERISQQAINTADAELSFLPALSSSPLDPFCGRSRRKSRSRSLSSHLDIPKPERTCSKVRGPVTIADVIKWRQMEMRVFETISCDRHRNWRICSSCSKRSLYFTWNNCCFLLQQVNSSLCNAHSS
ncbi:hypothetical protein AAFF_G00262830 [Aldrovandia affinis]|uniref:KIND domain-containing protein n=1 Tax=Aldrovandia affinis TaxID=143900 RepID=A0AAD7ST03_9TELE|nr:hypothetical protein AAFF_G00262830 [Aldrovandia affinis]